MTPSKREALRLYIRKALEEVHIPEGEREEAAYGRRTQVRIGLTLDEAREIAAALTPKPAQPGLRDRIAAMDPTAQDGDEWMVCFFCRTSLEGKSEEERRSGWSHAADCVWALASLGSPPLVERPVEDRGFSMTTPAKEVWQTRPWHELALRRLLAWNYAGPSRLYSDDGELQDNLCQPHIDFLRYSVAEIESAMTHRGHEAYERPLAAPVDAAPQCVTCEGTGDAGPEDQCRVCGGSGKRPTDAEIATLRADNVLLTRELEHALANRDAAPTRHRPILEEVRDWSDPAFLEGISPDLALFHIHNAVTQTLAPRDAAQGERAPDACTRCGRRRRSAPDCLLTDCPLPLSLEPPAQGVGGAEAWRDAGVDCFDGREWERVIEDADGNLVATIPTGCFTHVEASAYERAKAIATRIIGRAAPVEAETGEGAEEADDAPAATSPVSLTSSTATGFTAGRPT